MLKEFRDFAMRGNALDLAVGVIIGAAFGKIISSLVDNIIMPIVGIFVGGVDFSGLVLPVGNATVMYGVFINNVIDFAIIAFVIFLIVKGANSLKKSPPPAESTSKECPFCFSTIPIKATRCPNCTSELR